MSNQRMNVMIVMDDQHNAGAFGFMNHPVVKTPNFDKLAERSVCFTNAISCNGICMPSRLSLLTGTYVHAHGKYDNDSLTPARSGLPSLAKFLGSCGYYCGTTGKYHLGPWPDHGFHYRYDDVNQYSDFLDGRGKRFASRGPSLDKYPSPSVFCSISPLEEDETKTAYEAQCAIRFLRERPKDRPFFFWMNFDAPHGPYHLTRKYAEMYDYSSIPLVAVPDFGWDRLPREHLEWARTRSYDRMSEEQLKKTLAFYYGSISEVDYHWGRVMTAIEAEGLLENTIIIFISDHGDHAGDHRWVNKAFSYDSTLKTSLLAHLPTMSSGRFCEEIVQNIDIFPTVCEILGLNCSPLVQGKSFASLLKLDGNGKAGPRTYSLSEELPYRTIRTKRYKLVYAPPHNTWGEGETFTSQLYDLEKDPKEWNNLYNDPEYREIKSELMEKLLEATLASELPISPLVQKITSKEHELKYGPLYLNIREKARFFREKDLNKFDIKVCVKTRGEEFWAAGG